MAMLFLTFAIAMATGTFIESKYNTDTARIWIYNAWWFEGIMLVFMINFIGNIKRYKLWRKEVFQRDYYTCLICGEKGGELNAHHIKSFKDFPELRFEVDNGVTLCLECHYLKHGVKNG